jgi:hypothetical protein
MDQTKNVYAILLRERTSILSGRGAGLDALTTPEVLANDDQATLRRDQFCCDSPARE